MNENNTKRAVIYCRVSTKEQAEEGNSLVTQEKVCREYAEKNGYSIAEVYIEQGESAKTQDRTELQRMLHYCASKQHKVDAVIAYKIDRISRNTDDYSQIRILLKKFGVEIKSTSEYFENTPVGRFLENTMANIAQFDNDIRAERSVGGMKEAMREGRYVWKAPIGYHNAKVAGKSTIVVDEVLGPLMQETFCLIATNAYTIEDIRVRMAEKGITNTKGKPVTRSYFYTMLSNPVYAGWIIKFGEKHKGTFPPLVSEELFEQVQRVLKRKGTKHYKHLTDHPDFPLRRFVFNTEGKKLTGSWSKGRRKKYPFYRFLTGGNYARDTLHNVFAAYMNYFALPEEDLKALRTKVREFYTVRLQKENREQTRLQKYKEELKARQTAMVKKNLDGVIPDSVLSTQLADIEKELLDTEAELAKLVIQDTPQVGLEEAFELAQEFLKNPGAVWAKSDIDIKLQLQWFQFPSGMVIDGNYFRTTEICRFLKPKTQILGEKSIWVPPGIKISNTADVTTKKKLGKKPRRYSSKHTVNVNWVQVSQDIVTLFKILKKME